VSDGRQSITLNVMGTVIILGVRIRFNVKSVMAQESWQGIASNSHGVGVGR
jgi:hypothetical protein